MLVVCVLGGTVAVLQDVYGINIRTAWSYVVGFGAGENIPPPFVGCVNRIVVQRMFRLRALESRQHGRHPEILPKIRRRVIRVDEQPAYAPLPDQVEDIFKVLTSDAPAESVVRMGDVEVYDHLFG